MPYWSFSLNDQFVTHLGPGLGVNYYLTNVLAIGAIRGTVRLHSFVVLLTGLNTLTVEAAPANRGGAVSFIGSWKFAGNAAGPVLWLPIYMQQEWLAFALAGVACVVMAATVRRAGAVPRRDRPPPRAAAS